MNEFKHRNGFNDNSTADKDFEHKYQISKQQFDMVNKAFDQEQTLGSKINQVARHNAKHHFRTGDDRRKQDFIGSSEDMS